MKKVIIMIEVYVDSIPLYELQDLVDGIVMDAPTISDRGTKEKFLKVGAGFDIETSRIPLAKNSANLKAVAMCYHWQLGIGNYVLMGRRLNEMADLFAMLIDSIKNNKPKTKLLVFDANLGYEWQFCKHYWAKLGITKVFAKEERDPLYIEVGGVLMFREVLGLFGSSLAQIAKNYCGIPKLIGDLDYDVVRYTDTIMTDAEIKYCVRDVEILVKLAESYIFNTYMGKNPRLPLTKTGIVRDAIKRAFGKDLKKWKEKICSWMPTQEEYEIFRVKLFKGGISGGNILLLNKVLKDVRGADITSDYPFQMLTKPFPMGKAEPSGIKDTEELIPLGLPFIILIRFHKFKSRTSHSIMSAHKVVNKEEVKKSDATVLDNNRIQYAESIELYLNDVEYKSLKKAYKWKHEYVKKAWVFKDGYDLLPVPIRSTIIEWYMKKQALKADYSDTIEYKEAKEAVNSCFGMMCTALYLEEITFNEEECTLEADMSAKTYEEACKSLFLSPYWGFWVTSYARAMLTDVITRFPDCIVQYDTDSVYFIDDDSVDSNRLKKYLHAQNEFYKRTNNIRFMHEPTMETLGTWDFTEKFRRFKGLGSKRYMYEKQDGEIKVVVSGCRQNKPKDDSKPHSTIIDQVEYNNKKNNTDIDIFEFFKDGMLIDKEHSNKLCSKYIDIPLKLKSPSEEIIEIPSCIVLEPIEFRMKMSESHKDLMLSVQRYIQNVKCDRSVYDLWRSLKKLNTLRTIQASGLTTIGTLLPESTES